MGKRLRLYTRIDFMSRCRAWRNERHKTTPRLLERIYNVYTLLSP